jgi:hypothetical protein
MVAVPESGSLESGVTDDTDRSRGRRRHSEVRCRCLTSYGCRRLGWIVAGRRRRCKVDVGTGVRLWAVGGRSVAGSCVCHVLLGPATDRPPVPAGGGWLAQLGGVRVCWRAVVYGWSLCGAGGWMGAGGVASAVLRWLAVARVDGGLVIGCGIVEARRAGCPPVGLVLLCGVVGVLALGVVSGLGRPPPRQGGGWDATPLAMRDRPARLPEV